MNLQMLVLYVRVLYYSKIKRINNYNNRCLSLLIRILINQLATYII